MKFGGRFFQTKLLSRLSHIKVCRLLPSFVLFCTSVHSAYAFGKVKIQFFNGLNNPFCCFFFFFVVDSMIDYKWWWYYPIRKCRRGHLSTFRNTTGGFIHFNMLLLLFSCFSISETDDFLSWLIWNMICVQEIFCYQKWSHLSRKECS